MYKLNNGKTIKRLKAVRVIRFVEISELRGHKNLYCEQLMVSYPFYEGEELPLGESHYEHAYHKVIDVIGKIAQKHDAEEQL